MDEDDDLSLSNLFKSLRASPIADHSVYSSAAKRRRSKTCSALEKNRAAKGVQSSLLQSPAKGDIVWAKEAPFIWCPGQVKGFKGPLISISFFGCNKTRLFNSSEILGFEETYPRMVKMVGVKLSYEIGLALDELARNIAVGLKCCCRVSAGDEDRSLAVKSGLNPQEIFRFVLDKAVSPQVVEEEIGTVVRVSAALNTFRHGLVVCNTSEVDEGFCAEAVLDCVLDMAVNQCIDDKAVAQLYAFSRFVSVKPAWFYQLDWEFEDDSLESRKIEADLELPDCTTEDELHHGRTSDPEFNVSIKPQEECELLDVDVNHNLKGRDICVINMVDFSIFDMDEKYDSLIYDQHQIDANGAHLADRGICKNTSHERILHSCTEGASGISEVNAEETDTNVVCASLNSALVISSPQNDPNHILKVGEEINLNSFLVPNLENATRGGNTNMPVHCDKYNTVKVPSSAENLSLRTVPLYRGQLHSLPVNKCNVSSPNKVLNLSIKPHSRPEVCLNTINAAQCIDLIPEMAPFAETALQISANKRKLCEPTTFELHKLSQNSLPCSVNNAIDKPLFDANCNNDATNLHFHNQSHFLNNPGHVSKPYYIKRQQNHRPGSNRKSFYISPLTRDGLSSTNNHRLKSLDCNNHRNSNSSVSVLLNMKFPKDYSLPSKEQLEKKFSVFGPLDHTRTKIFFYTGVGQVVFLHQADALVAYNYVMRKRIFGKINVRFWFYKYENCRNGNNSNHSSLNLKSCLKKSRAPELIDYRKNSKVRFRA